MGAGCGENELWRRRGGQARQDRRRSDRHHRHRPPQGAVRCDLHQEELRLDLRTHMPFDFKDTQFNVTAGGSYGTQVKKASPRISAMFSKRFDTGIGEIGVLWDFAFSRLYQQSSDLQVGAMFGEYVPTSKRADHLAFVPSSFNWNENESKRDR